MEPLLNGTGAPPLESLPKHSTTSTTHDLENTTNRNPMSASNSRCSSVSSSTSTSNPPCNSNNSSVSLSANASFANLSLSSGSLQNINISNTLPQEQEPADKENNPVWNPNTDTTHDTTTAIAATTNRRRSARISKKRKLGHVAYYTPQSWKALYVPPKKKQKTKHKAAPKHLKPTTKALKPSVNKTNASKPVTASQRLFAQNSKMKKIQSQLENRKTVPWLKHHYSAFEPFLSDKVKRRLRPKKKSEAIEIAKPKALEAQPEALQHGVLRDYQLYSVNWLRQLRHNGIPAILADEMGLGKTIQSIATIAAFLEDDEMCADNNNRESPSLIICPLSVAEAWMSEFEKWMPQLRCVLFHGPKVQRENLMKYSLVFGAFDICVTTYEIATNNKGFLSKFMWNYFILDEAHRIKNEKTDWHCALKTIWSRCLYSVLLTGTPIQNNLHELWSLLSFMFGDRVFDAESGEIFDSAYDQASNIQNKRLLARTPYLLAPFFLRRLKSEVELSLPPKEEIIIKLEMSTQQRKYYKTFLAAHASLIDQVSDTMYGGDKHKAKTQVSAWKKLRALYMNLRKIALHPFLLEDHSNGVRVDNGQELISHSSKLQLLDKLLARLSAEGHRVLLFSCFTLVLNLLEVYCEYRGYKYLRLDGTTSRIRRKIDIMRFNDDPHSPFFMYLISNRAGGLGINLQSADTVIHFDTDWNPQADLQAQARAHRIGQKNMVKIYRLISKHTVEERILFRSQQKLYLDAVVNQGVNAVVNDDKFDLDNADLLGAIKFGAQCMFDGDTANGNATDDIDLDILLERSYNISDDHKEERQKLLKDLSHENNVRDFNFSQKLKAGNEFEGTTYEKKEFNLRDEVDWSKKKRNASSTQVKELVVDGLRFTTRIERNPMIEFYTQCADWIYDSRNTTPFVHEDHMCWGCDTAYTGDEEIIQCQNCPKTFHANGACWQGEKTKMGIYICSQHQCFKCGAKTSECGMILRCLGCQMSYCYPCSPDAHWKSESGNDGLYFIDECKVAQHYRYSLPQSAYMYILCGEQCKKFYSQVYSKRDLRDISLKYDDLPEIILDGLENNHKNKNKKQRLRNLVIDKRIHSYDMPHNVMDRLRMNLSGDCQLLERLYDILYEDRQSQDGEEENEKEDIDYILNEHFVEIPSLNRMLSTALSLPQWKQCIKCKKWRICAVKLNEIMRRSHGINTWQCNVADGFSELCETRKQKVPNSDSHSADQLSVLRFQRELMAVNYKIELNKRESDYRQLHESQLKKEMIEKQIERLIQNYKVRSLDHQFEMKKKPHLCEARFLGIGAWKGFEAYREDHKLCEFYQHLLSSFRHWRVESLKTLCDLIGFFVVSKKKQRGSKQFRVDQMALSYNKDKIINALALFLIYPSNGFLQLTTRYFSKQ